MCDSQKFLLAGGFSKGQPHFAENIFKGIDARFLSEALGVSMHVAEKLVFHSERGPLRFEQSAAIVGPNDYGPVVMPSGFSLYTVTNGVIDAGTFVPLAMPRQ